MKKYYIDSLEKVYEIGNKEMGFNDEDSTIIWFETSNIIVYADCSQDIKVMLQRIYYIVTKNHTTDNVLNSCTIGEIVDNIIDYIGGDDWVLLGSLV